MRFVLVVLAYAVASAAFSTFILTSTPQGAWWLQ